MQSKYPCYPLWNLSMVNVLQTHNKMDVSTSTNFNPILDKVDDTQRSSERRTSTKATTFTFQCETNMEQENQSECICIHPISLDLNKSHTWQKRRNMYIYHVHVNLSYVHLHKLNYYDVCFHYILNLIIRYVGSII